MSAVVHYNPYGPSGCVQCGGSVVNIVSADGKCILRCEYECMHVSRDSMREAVTEWNDRQEEIKTAWRNQR